MTYVRSYGGIRPVVEIPLDSVSLNTWDHTGDSVSDAYTLEYTGTVTETATKDAAITSAQVEFGAVTWSNGTASITLTSTDSSLYIQYQKNGTDGAWTTGSSKGTATVTGLSNGDTIYVRLYDGTNTGGYASFNVVDYIGPTVTVETTKILAARITVEVSATDAQSGMGSSPEYTYYYKKTGTTGWTTATTTTETTYTFTGLDAETDYDIKVSVADAAGAVGSGRISTTTDDLIGYYVAYTPDSGTYSKVTGNSTYTGTTNNSTDFATDTNLNWQIWSIDDDTLTLIADDTSQNGGYDYTSNSTYGYCLYLSNYTGYNNAVKILNDICETCYSNASIGATGRSFTREDIEAVMDWSYWAPTEYYYSTSYDSYTFISTKQYTGSYAYYPYIWQYEDYANIDGTTVNSASYTYDSTTGTLTYTGNGWRSNYQDDYYPSTSYKRLQASSYIEPTETYWYKSLTSSSYWTNSKYASLYYCAHYSWLASRCVYLYSTGAYFSLSGVDSNGYVYGGNLYSSGGGISNIFRGVRPVVEIPLTSNTLDIYSTTGETADDAFVLK